MIINFGHALILLRNGSRMSRKKWKNKELFMDKNNTVKIKTLVENVYGGQSEVVKTYQFISEDRFKEDWEEVGKVQNETDNKDLS